MSTVKLTNPTDDQLSAAVAEHVEGWTDAEIKITGTGVFYGQTDVPPFATSADAVLPLLEKHERWECGRFKHGYRIYFPRNDGEGSAPTFARAACIALLRANGIEVEVTP